ncbi:hypothetical protein BDN67DRAFT_873480, partial [Paxillus ammoniavirescens]
MMMLHEELTGMGAPIDDRDFTAMILNSIPDSVCTLIHMTTATIHTTGQLVTSDKIINIIFEEADH